MEKKYEIEVFGCGSYPSKYEVIATYVSSTTNGSYIFYNKDEEVAMYPVSRTVIKSITKIVK